MMNTYAEVTAFWTLKIDAVGEDSNDTSDLGDAAHLNEVWTG